MRKILLLTLLSTLIPFLGNAQIVLTNNGGATITNDTIYINGLISDEIIKTYVFFTNESEAPLEVLVRKIELDIVDGSDCTFCWNNYCFSPMVFEVDNPITLEPGQTSEAADFYSDFYPQGNAGTSLVKYEFFNPRDEFETVNVVLKITVDDPTNIAWQPTISQWELRDARPNPARDFTQIGVAIPGGSRTAQIVVRNLVGNTVITENIDVNTSRVRLSTSNLSNGIYIYSLIIDNQTVSSKRLIVAN